MAVAVVAVGSIAGSSDLTITAFDPTAAAEGLILFAHSSRDGTAGTPTFGAEAFIPWLSIGDRPTLDVFVLKPVSTAAADVDVAFADNGRGQVIGCIALSGLNTTSINSMFDAAVSLSGDGDSSLAVTTEVDGMVIDGISTESTPTDDGGSSTEEYSLEDSVFGAASSEAATTTSTTVAWTIGDVFEHGAISCRPGSAIAEPSEWIRRLNEPVQTVPEVIGY